MIDPCIRVNPAAEDSFVYSVLPTLGATLRIIQKKTLLFWRGSGNCDNLGGEEREWKRVRKGGGEKGWKKKIKKGEGIRKERRRSTKRSRKVKNPLEKRGKITKTKDYEKQNTHEKRHNKTQYV